MARSSDSIFPISLLRDRTFQAREIRRVIVLSLAYLAITTLLIGVFYHVLLGHLLEGASPMLFVSEDSALANEAVPPLTSVLGQWMLSMLGVNAVITVVLAVFITRRLGQPILAIKRALREIGNGNLDVRLREGDANDFNEIVVELASAVQSVRAQIGTAKQSMEEYTELQDQPEATEAHSSDVDTALENCRSALNFFQVSTEQDAAVEQLGNSFPNDGMNQSNASS